MSKTIEVTADQLRFCQSGLKMTIGIAPSCYLVFEEGKTGFIRGGEQSAYFCPIIDEKYTVNVNSEEFSASVLASIEIWMPDVDKVWKITQPDDGGSFCYAEEANMDDMLMAIAADPRPDLDHYEFHKTDGIWRMM